MEKKRNKKLLVFVFIFVAIFLVGLIGLIIPKKSSNYLYYNLNSSTLTDFGEYGFKASFYIENNSGKKLEDASIKIKYVVEAAQFNKLFYEKIIVLDLEKGSNNKIEFIHNENDFGVYLLDKIEKMTIVINDEAFEIENKDFINKPNTYLIICLISGILGSAASFVVWFVSNKKLINPNIEEQIIDAVKSLHTTSKKDEKVTCKYCGCQYIANNISKCTSCGAHTKAEE